jgi:hypothetical protein
MLSDNSQAHKMVAHSQLAPLPSELPFRIVSKTIGQGAYAWCAAVFRVPQVGLIAERQYKESSTH